ncbi:MAG: hypothetical protein HY298_05350 [Verrucomicrobia bacterium]|nr:hypothetical protein [Verrucomicrobiota bacterium]
MRALTFCAAVAAVASVCSAKPVTSAAPSGSFRLEALVDFVDDALRGGRTLTARDIDAMMTRLAGLGIRRVSWAFYADGRGGYLNPTDTTVDYRGGWKHYDATYRELGNPLKVAVECGHRHGLEVYAYFKPYENGPGVMFPAGSPQAKEWGLLDCIGGKLAWMDRFVRDHPHLRIQRRADDLPVTATNAAVRGIRLTKQDATPTRLTREHIQIWTSPDNFRYRRAEVKFTCHETVEAAPREARDQFGKVMTRKGDPVRVLTLSGLDLTDNYILVTSDFTGGKGDFVNSGLAILTTLDAQGREIPGVFASGGAVWNRNLVNFREGGLMFDYGWGAAPVRLDAPNADGRSGFIAFARGRNEYLPGALCETELDVQKFWLGCLEEIIAAGVDGVDFREENHSTHTDYPEDYGFNAVILAKARTRPGDLLANIAEVRGEAYTDFLRECNRRLSRAGIAMRYNLQLDFFRPDPPRDRLLAYPANIRFDWQRWVDEGLMDEAILRFYSLPFSAIFNDATAQEMIRGCRAHGIPITVNRYVRQAADQLPVELQRIRTDGRFSGFIFYETNEYLDFGATPGTCRVTSPPLLKALTEAIGGTGLR